MEPEPNRFCAWCGKALGYDPRLPKDPPSGMCEACRDKLAAELQSDLSKKRIDKSLD